MRPGRAAVAVLAALAVGLAAAPARADGDPASDYLGFRPVFLSYSEGAELTDAGKRLLETVDEANARGYTIRVAVIATPTDLGAIGGIFGQPQKYAEFLGKELAFAYDDRLLIVMPAGFGLSKKGEPLTAEQGALQGIPIGPGVSGLDEAAARAVVRLAAAAGVTVDVSGSSGSSWYSSAWFLALVAACTAAVIAGGFLFGRRWLGRARTDELEPT